MNKPVPFDIDEQNDCLCLTTGRLRLEFPRFPWHMQVFDADSQGDPFFSQRFDDRAYWLAASNQKRGSAPTGTPPLLF